jgi:hypothetical protein
MLQRFLDFYELDEYCLVKSDVAHVAEVKYS